MLPNSKLVAALFMITALQSAGFAESGIPREAECVILIHGLGRTSFSMKRLEWTLARAGYQTINVSYPSRWLSISELADNYLKQSIATKIPKKASKVHFITHSMGGIILRQYLAQHSVSNLGSVVMLAPPNQGSEIADAFKRNPIGRWILGPAGCQLGTAPTDVPRQLGAVDFHAGVVAGNRSLNPWFSRMLPGEDDGKVSVETTRVKGMKQHLVVENSHTWMMWRGKTIRQIIAFLSNGRFND